MLFVPPKLKMVESDIRIAISRQFRKECSSLIYDSNNESFSVDTDGGCAFFIQSKFIGSGEYSVKGQAKLISKTDFCSLSKWYDVSFRAYISEIDNSPTIKIIPPITIKTK